METSLCLGLYSGTIPWVKKAHSMGYQVVIVDQCPPKANAYFEEVKNEIKEYLYCSFEDSMAIKRFARKHGVSFVLPHPTAGDALLAAGELNDELSLPGISHQAACKAADKKLFFDHLQANDLPRPFYQVLANSLSPPNLEHLQYPCIAKPRLGAGSIGVKKIINATQLSEFLTSQSANHGFMLIGENDEYVIQEFVRGSYMGLNGFIINNEVHIFHQWEGKPQDENDLITMYGPYYTTSDRPVTPVTRQAVNQLIQSLEIKNSSFMLELIVDSNYNIVSFIEINLRPAGMASSEAFDKILGYDNKAIQIELASGKKPTIIPKPTTFSHLAIINFFFEPGTIEMIKWPKIHNQIAHFETELKPNTVVGIPKNALDSAKMGRIIVSGKSKKQALKAGKAFLKGIRVRYKNEPKKIKFNLFGKPHPVQIYI